MNGNGRIEVRKPAFVFDEVPRDWLGGLTLPTHLANALHLLFPLGERFFIRSVKRFAERIEDPALREQVRGFMGQEVRHGLEHERAFARLEAQGYELQSFLRWYEHLAYEVIEPKVPPQVSLAVTVALEHFTAMFAREALRRDFLSELADPVMRDLLLWHAVEELEHKSVAFDVLARTHPSWALRVTGLGMGAALLLFFWGAGVRHLMKQEPPARRRGLLGQLRASRANNPLLNGGVAKAFVRALHPRFHPSQDDDAALAGGWIAANAGRLGLAVG